MAEPPAQSFVAPSTLGTSLVPVRFSWSATDNTSGSGVADYTLQQSTNGGAYQETSTRISYLAGSWAGSTYSSSFYGGYVKSASAYAPKRSSELHGAQYSLGGDQGCQPWQSVRVRGRRLRRRRHLYSSTLALRQVVFRKDGLNPLVDHTIKVRVLGTAGRPTVDAFMVLR